MNLAMWHNSGQWHVSGEDEFSLPGAWLSLERRLDVQGEATITWALVDCTYKPVRAKSLQSCPTLCDPMDCSLQASLSMGFSRQESWSGLPCPSPGDLPNPGIELTSLMSPALASGFFTTSATWEAPHLNPVAIKHMTCPWDIGRWSWKTQSIPGLPVFGLVQITVLKALLLVVKCSLSTSLS